MACSAVSQKCWQSIYRLEDTLLWIYHLTPHLSATACLELCSVVHQDNYTNNSYQVLPASSWCGLWPFFRQKAIKWETHFIWVHFLLLGAELPSFYLRLLLFQCLLVIFWWVFLSRAYSYLWEGGSGRRYYTIIRSRITIYFYKICQEANKAKLMTTFMQSWVRIQVFIPSSLCPQNWELLFILSLGGSTEDCYLRKKSPPWHPLFLRVIQLSSVLFSAAYTALWHSWVFVCFCIICLSLLEYTPMSTRMSFVLFFTLCTITLNLCTK